MIAQDIERVWRDEVPVARSAKGGPIPGSPKSGGTRVSNVEGLTADSILARLKRDNPELAQQVISGETTANAGNFRYEGLGIEEHPANNQQSLVTNAGALSSRGY
ncbi:hypothetical protein [Brevibacterium paucivorans]